VAGYKFVIEERTPQQQNNYDCGIHTLLGAETVARAFLQKDEFPTAEELRQAVDPSKVLPIKIGQEVVKAVP